MSAEIAIKVDGVERLRRELGVRLTAASRASLNRKIGERVVDLLRGHLAKMSGSRHKVADRLGATHTNNFENAPGRTAVASVGDGGVKVEIANTYGLERAFGPVHITPKRARALTIPIHRISAHKRVKELEGEGHRITRVGRMLGEYDGSEETYTDPKDGKTKKRKRLRKLYVLVRSVTVPQDAGLLPTNEQVKAAARDAAQGWLEAESL